MKNRTELRIKLADFAQLVINLFIYSKLNYLSFSTHDALHIPNHAIPNIVRSSYSGARRHRRGICGLPNQPVLAVFVAVVLLAASFPARVGPAGRLDQIARPRMAASERVPNQQSGTLSSGELEFV